MENECDPHRIAAVCHDAWDRIIEVSRDPELSDEDAWIQLGLAWGTYRYQWQCAARSGSLPLPPARSRTQDESKFVRRELWSECLAALWDLVEWGATQPSAKPKPNLGRWDVAIGDVIQMNPGVSEAEIYRLLSELPGFNQKRGYVRDRVRKTLREYGVRSQRPGYVFVAGSDWPAASRPYR